MNELRKRNKINYVRKTPYVIPLLLSFIALGFAAIATTLGINGNVMVGKVTYDIHFENVSVSEGSIEAITPATIDSDDNTKIDFGVNLKLPGQYYEFEVDVVNKGDLDAELSDISLTGLSDAQKRYLSYTYSYSDGIELKEHDSLKSGEQDRIKVRIEFMEDITVEDLPSEAATINLSFSLTYRQDVGNGVERKKVSPYSYVVISSTTMKIGQNIPSGVTLRSTAEEAVADWESIADWESMLGFGNTRPYYLKHKLDDEEKIEESYVEFIYNGQTYALRGGDGGASYEVNKEVLLSAFGSGNCIDNSPNWHGSSNFYCCVGGLNVNADADGSVSVNEEVLACEVYVDGTSECH